MDRGAAKQSHSSLGYFLPQQALFPQVENERTSVPLHVGRRLQARVVTTSKAQHQINLRGSGKDRTGLQQKTDTFSIFPSRLFPAIQRELHSSARGVTLAVAANTHGQGSHKRQRKYGRRHAHDTTFFCCCTALVTKEALLLRACLT